MKVLFLLLLTFRSGAALADIIDNYDLEQLPAGSTVSVPLDLTEPVSVPEAYKPSQCTEACNLVIPAEPGTKDLAPVKPALTAIVLPTAQYGVRLVAEHICTGGARVHETGQNCKMVAPCKSYFSLEGLSGMLGDSDYLID